MNIVDALTSHHGTLRQLYNQSLSDPSVFDEFIHHLTVHHTMEEKYFYDILEQQAQAHEAALEAVNEHHIIELIIKDVQRFPRDHERFAIKIESLGEYTTHHLDEEEMEIFPQAQQLFAQETLFTLGKLFLEAKNKLLGVTLPQVPNEIGKAASAPPRRKQEPAGSGPKGKEAGEKAPSEAAQGHARGLGIGSLKK